MRPLAEMSVPGTLRGLLFDLDDTFTTSGKITAQAYSALERAQSAGLRAVAVTGRPAGWCDHIARMWPVDAVIGENGAFYFHHHSGKLHKRYAAGDAARLAQQSRLKSIAAEILEKVPGCALASDQAYRETDLAIDYCEDVPALPLEAAERIAALMRAAGLNAKISSIHVNGWFGGHDKLSAMRLLFREKWGVDIGKENPDYVYAGDSPNDAPMFAFFERSVGVANIERFAGHLPAAPRYVTRAAAGAGFAELVAHLLQGR